MLYDVVFTQKFFSYKFIDLLSFLSSPGNLNESCVEFSE